MKMKTTKTKFYCRFYRTGEFRKVEAANLAEAYIIATEKFGDSAGNWTIGELLRNGDKIPNTGIPLKR